MASHYGLLAEGKSVPEKKKKKNAMKRSFGCCAIITVSHATRFRRISPISSIFSQAASQAADARPFTSLSAIAQPRQPRSGGDDRRRGGATCTSGHGGRHRVPTLLFKVQHAALGWRRARRF